MTIGRDWVVVYLADMRRRTLPAEHARTLSYAHQCARPRGAQLRPGLWHRPLERRSA